MDAKRSLRWAGYYFLLTAVGALAGLALVGVGLGFGGLDAWQVYQQTEDAAGAVRGAAPWLAVSALGVLVWRFVKAWALYATLTGATREELADTYDNEKVKSDILSVLDERLSSMQQDLQSVNREIRELKRDEEEQF